MKHARTAENETRAILEGLEKGVRDVFTSENYMKYLETYSKFHNYSINNCILILMANPKASHVASYRDWQTKFNRQVLKGEHGIRILVPTPKKVTVEKEVTNDDGTKSTETVEKKYMYFKTGTVFDISQTTGEPLPQLAEQLTYNSEELDKIIETIFKTSTVPISYDETLVGENSANGYYKLDSQEIYLKPELSSVHKLKTLIRKW